MERAGAGVTTGLGDLHYDYHTDRNVTQITDRWGRRDMAYNSPNPTTAHKLPNAGSICIEYNANANVSVGV